MFHFLQLGPDKVIQVCTDNASVCKAAGAIIQEKHPHITWTGCGAHCLDLLLEDIGKLPWVASVIQEGKALVKFITNHHKSLALYREHSEKALLKPGETRFATSFIMLERWVSLVSVLRARKLSHLLA